MGSSFPANLPGCYEEKKVTIQDNKLRTFSYKIEVKDDKSFELVITRETSISGVNCKYTIDSMTIFSGSFSVEKANTKDTFLLDFRTNEAFTQTGGNYMGIPMPSNEKIPFQMKFSSREKILEFSKDLEQGYKINELDGKLTS